jgi:DNA-binding Xre family transcriptional regulator
MKPDFQIETIFRLLKTHLKIRELSYKDLAKRMKMSESNLKRIFSTRSCGLEQLARICEASDTNLFELIKTAAKTEVPRFELKPEVEEFFLNYFDCFIFYRNLGAAQDPNLFIKNLKIPLPKIQDYLHALEKLGLVRKNKDKIELHGYGYVDLTRVPRLRKMLADKWVPWFFNRVLDQHSNKSSDYYLNMTSTALSPTHREQFVNEIKQIITRYKELGIKDQEVGHVHPTPVGICIGIGPHRVGMFEENSSKLLRPI